MSLEVAIARIEEQMKAQTDMMREFVNSQKIHNANFYATEREVTEMKANAKGAWWVLGILGTMVSSVAGAIGAWFITRNG